jgi:predicted short-subunit dehydrogenase-like oxidoreductase (DUF2520 family)
MNFLILGRGKVGTGLYGALRKNHQDVRLESARGYDHEAIKSAECIILAVQDPFIEPLADQLSQWIRPGQTVIHCAGSFGISALRACTSRGAHAGVMHPLISFASKEHPPELQGASFVSSGTPAALEAARTLSSYVGAHLIEAPVHGAAYHATAAIVANGSTALVDTCLPLLKRLGIDHAEASMAMARLLRSVADNIQGLGLPGALTGPVARGDVDTFRAHRAALATEAPEILRTYDALAPTILRCARDAGLPDSAADAILAALKEED